VSGTVQSQNKRLFLLEKRTKNKKQQNPPNTPPPLQQKNPCSSPCFRNALLPLWWEGSGDGAIQRPGTKRGVTIKLESKFNILFTVVQCLSNRSRERAIKW